MVKIIQKQCQADEETDICSKPQKQATRSNNPKIVEAGYATRFKPGTSPNPGGKPVGARNRLQADFLNALVEDFSAHGKEAVRRCREEKPDVYIRIIASLMPKELEIKRPLDNLTDEELDAAIVLLREKLGVAAIH